MFLLTKEVPMSFWERLRKFFWREKSGLGRRVECPIGQSKHPKSPNPTLQLCWVHPTKSQNSLHQEVDVQLIHAPTFPPAHVDSHRPFSCLPSRLAGNGSEDVRFFSENLVGARSRVDPLTLLSNVCWECVFVSHWCFPIRPHMGGFGTPPKRTPPKR